MGLEGPFVAVCLFCVQDFLLNRNAYCMAIHLANSCKLHFVDEIIFTLVVLKPPRLEVTKI